ncbi:MAG: CPBP family intramembrane metalloprotease [Anaerolineae bacterium]|nr:CPBP family intramembrane metalloprotease [Anaerolineae bacterium]
MMPIGLGLFAVIALILLANIIEAGKNETYFRLFTWLLLLINLPVMLFGIALVILPADLLTGLMTASSGLLSLNWQTAGLSLVLMGLWGFVVSLPASRRLLARWLPLDAASPVHALGLVLAGYLLGNTIFSLTQGGLEELAETAVSTSIYEILLMQTLFAAIALLGVGLYTRRSPGETRTRLGLERPTGHQILVGTAWIMVLVMLQAIAGGIWMLMDSSQAELLEGISSELLGDIDTVLEWALLAGATGVGEELLFRGAIQPIFGLGVTAFLFATAHVQYGITPVTVIVFIIGIILGLIRRRYNTTTSIFVHAGYNFVLGMLSLVALQLEQMIG